jgi:hypothetical protein
MVLLILPLLFSVLGFFAQGYRLADPRHLLQPARLNAYKQRGLSQRYLIRINAFRSHFVHSYYSTRISLSQSSPPSSRANAKTSSGSAAKPAAASPKESPELDPSMQVRLLVPGNESSKPDFMHGVVPYSEARRLAASLGLDLILLNDKQTPPIYKVCDGPKFKYDLEKKRKDSTKSKVELKEISLSYDIGEHDLEVRAKAAMRFLGDGDRVSVLDECIAGRRNSYH